MNRSFSVAWVCIFLFGVAFIWASLDAAAAFAAFWFGAIGWSIGRTWPHHH
jgi:TRAP-type C4-dicarboxylate transport system permease small subunit